MPTRKTIKTKHTTGTKRSVGSKHIVGEAVSSTTKQSAPKLQTYGFRRGGKGERKFERTTGLQAGGEKVRSYKTTIVGRGFKAKAISPDLLDPGAIITFNYRGTLAHDPNPLVLLLSNGFYKNKLHAINLKYVPKHLLSDIQTFVVDNHIEDVHPRTFYNTKVKPFLRNILDKGGISTYRTYSKTSCSNFKIYVTNINELDL